jgi:hypothetical protein
MDEEARKSVDYILDRIKEGVEQTNSARPVVKMAQHLYLLLTIVAIAEERDEPFSVGDYRPT